MKGECSTNHCSTNKCGPGCNCGCNKGNICWCKLSIAFGLSNALFIFIMGLLATFNGCCLERVMQLSVMYPGYEATLVGSFLGALSAFLCAFLFFRVAGWIFTALSKCCNKCCCNKSGCSTSASDTEKTDNYK